MIEINLENSKVDLVIDLIASAIGVAAGCLVGAAFDPVISQQTGFTKTAFQAGSFGIGYAVAHEVAVASKDEIVETVASYNTYACEINAGRELLKGEGA